MKKHYAAIDFVKAMRAEALHPALTITGMAKPPEAGDDTLLFSPAGCEHWISLALEWIEQVEHLGETACREHSHPQVRIHFKASSSPEAQMLGELLKVTLATMKVSPEARFGLKRPPGFCGKFCSLCGSCRDPFCDACQKCDLCFDDADFAPNARPIEPIDPCDRLRWRCAQGNRGACKTYQRVC